MSAQNDYFVRFLDENPIKEDNLEEVYETLCKNIECLEMGKKILENMREGKGIFPKPNETMGC